MVCLSHHTVCVGNRCVSLSSCSRGRARWSSDKWWRIPFCIFRVRVTSLFGTSSQFLSTWSSRPDQTQISLTRPSIQRPTSNVRRFGIFSLTTLLQVHRLVSLDFGCLTLWWGRRPRNNVRTFVHRSSKEMSHNCCNFRGSGLRASIYRKETARNSDGLRARCQIVPMSGRLLWPPSNCRCIF